jgi:hypothetical protein
MVAPWRNTLDKLKQKTGHIRLITTVGFYIPKHNRITVPYNMSYTRTSLTFSTNFHLSKSIGCAIWNPPISCRICYEHVILLMPHSISSHKFYINTGYPPESGTCSWNLSLTSGLCDINKHVTGSVRYNIFRFSDVLNTWSTNCK